MFKTSSKRKKKTTAQAMVEFALALPVLLLVVYGLIETGRLLFIYASVVTAARQAVRYGSATGLNGSGTPYYQDCAGITAAANSVAFINPFSNIQITYDGGLQSNGTPVALNYSCPSNPLTASKIENGYRILVQVSSQYSPIVPLVPFGPFTITSMSARTLLESISVGATALPSGSMFGSGGIYLQVTTQVSSVSGCPAGKYCQVGQVITYTYTITNASSVTVSSPFTISDPLTTWNCPTGTLAPGDSVNCTGTYTVTQADLDSGSVVSAAAAVATPSSFTTNTVNTSVSAVQSPALFLTKSSNVPNAAPGTTITYTYKLKNSGNVTLSQPFSVSDNKLGTISCTGTTLAPGSTLTCTKQYTVSSTDGANGAIINTATAHATFNGQDVPSNQATLTVGTKSLYLSVLANPTSAATTTITFTYNFFNASSTSMSGPFSATGSTGNCSVSGTLAAGNSISCNVTYTVTQTDVDQGMVNDSATATAGGGSIQSNPVSASVTVIQSPAITLTKSASPTLATSVGQVVTYTYTIQNSGNATLVQPFSVTDDKVSSVNCAAATSPLAPGASTTCTASYTIAQADIDAGSVINHATATGKTQTGLSAASNVATFTVITFNAPRLTLQKYANPTVATSAGQVITYTYKLENTGNTPLVSPFTVADDHVVLPNTVDCSKAVSPIPVGGSTTCTATYTVTSGDITAQSVVNHATATATVSGSTNTVSSSASATVATGQIACDPRHSALRTAPFGLTIFNKSPIATITIAQIQIYYDATNPVGQFINTIQYGGTTIWAGSASGSPGVFNTPFNGDVTLVAGGNKFLNVTFNSNYVVDGSERILVTFVESGCPPLDSSNSSQLP